MLINSIRSLLSGNPVDISTVVAQILSVVVVILIILPFHEWAHAWSAYKLGDSTAKYSGRLTFNPLASVDLMGAVFLLLFGFGWAKPVPVNANNLKNPRRDMALVALAGPVANIVAALTGALIICAIFAFSTTMGAVVSFILSFLQYYVIVNVSVAAFNLLPVPPLDGSKIIGALMPQRIYYKFLQYQNIIYIVFLFLMLTGGLSSTIGVIQNFLYNIVITVAMLPFKLFGLLGGF